jgi:hypothetical protein
MKSKKQDYSKSIKLFLESMGFVIYEIISFDLYPTTGIFDVLYSNISGQNRLNLHIDDLMEYIQKESTPYQVSLNEFIPKAV